MNQALIDDYNKWRVASGLKPLGEKNNGILLRKTPAKCVLAIEEHKKKEIEKLEKQTPKRAEQTPKRAEQTPKRAEQTPKRVAPARLSREETWENLKRKLGGRFIIEVANLG